MMKGNESGEGGIHGMGDMSGMMGMMKMMEQCNDMMKSAQHNGEKAKGNSTEVTFVGAGAGAPAPSCGVRR